MNQYKLTGTATIRFEMVLEEESKKAVQEYAEDIILKAPTLFGLHGDVVSFTIDDDVKESGAIEFHDVEAIEPVTSSKPDPFRFLNLKKPLECVDCGMKFPIEAEVRADSRIPFRCTKCDVKATQRVTDRANELPQDKLSAIERYNYEMDPAGWHLKNG